MSGENCPNSIIIADRLTSNSSRSWTFPHRSYPLSSLKFGSGGCVVDDPSTSAVSMLDSANAAEVPGLITSLGSILDGQSDPNLAALVKTVMSLERSATFIFDQDVTCAKEGLAATVDPVWPHSPAEPISNPIGFIFRGSPDVEGFTFEDGVKYLSYVILDAEGLTETLCTYSQWAWETPLPEPIDWMNKPLNMEDRGGIYYAVAALSPKGSLCNWARSTQFDYSNTVVDSPELSFEFPYQNIGLAYKANEGVKFNFENCKVEDPSSATLIAVNSKDSSSVPGLPETMSRIWTSVGEADASLLRDIMGLDRSNVLYFNQDVTCEPATNNPAFSAEVRKNGPWSPYHQLSNKLLLLFVADESLPEYNGFSWEIGMKYIIYIELDESGFVKSICPQYKWGGWTTPVPTPTPTPEPTPIPHEKLSISPVGVWKKLEDISFPPALCPDHVALNSETSSLPNRDWGFGYHNYPLTSLKFKDFTCEGENDFLGALTFFDSKNAQYVEGLEESIEFLERQSNVSELIPSVVALKRSAIFIAAQNFTCIGGQADYDLDFQVNNEGPYSPKHELSDVVGFVFRAEEGMANGHGYEFTPGVDYLAFGMMDPSTGSATLFCGYEIDERLPTPTPTVAPKL
uniref:Uncharacterized protein n=2 Tax=Rhodosorus marinus TaxID=101924 RepID=A0A7S0BTH0_9RHOD